jgi:hypothetical protein
MIPANVRVEWAAWRAILMQPLLARRAEGSLWLSWMLLVLALAFAAGSMAVASKKATLLCIVCLGLSLGMLLVMWWGYLFNSILTQSSPAALQLAPHMRKRTRRVMVTAWAVVTLAMTLAVGMPLGYPGHVAVITGLVLLEMTVMASTRRLAIVATLLWLTWFADFRLPAWLTAFWASDAAVAVGVLLLVLDGRAALRRMFGTPYGLKAWKQSQLAPSPATLQVVRLLSEMRIDGPRRQPQFTRVLGPAAFGGTRTLLAVLVVVCVAIRVLIEAQGTGSAHERLYMTRALVLIAVLFVQAMMTFSEASRCYKRRTEQALVRLSPAAPVAGDINRSLASYLLGSFVTMWGLSSVVALAMLWVLGATAGEVLRAAAVCGVSLVLAGALLRDYARGVVTDHLQPLLFAVGAAAALLLAPTAVRGKFSGQAWAWFALAGMTATVLFIWRRWRRMVQAAPAFPAARKR